MQNLVHVRIHIFSMWDKASLHLFYKQITNNSCSDKEMSFPVVSWLIPSIAATAEKAQQHCVSNKRLVKSDMIIFFFDCGFFMKQMELEISS